MEDEKLRVDILGILYSKRNGEKYVSYRELYQRLGYVDNLSLLNEIISMNYLRLIKIQNGLTRFLEGSDFQNIMSITPEGETYFKQSLLKKKLLLLAQV